MSTSFFLLLFFFLLLLLLTFLLFSVHFNLDATICVQSRHFSVSSRLRLRSTKKTRFADYLLLLLFLLFVVVVVVAVVVVVVL